MHQRTTAGSWRSSPAREELHEGLRNAIHQLLQAALEAEATELLGRVWGSRRAAPDDPTEGPWRLLTLTGTVTLCHPGCITWRSGSAGARKRSQGCGPSGAGMLSQRGLQPDSVGGGALSACTVACRKEQWQAEWKAWRTRQLDGLPSS